MPEIRQLESCSIDEEAFLAARGLVPQWYAAYTSARHEKHIAGLLQERNVETFLPLHKAVRQWKKSSQVVLELPLFPCYVFVRIKRSARATVLSVPGVLSIVGSSKEPWPMPSLEIEALQSSVRMGKAEPHPFLRAGERVRIKAGSMAGVEGILVRKKNGLRCVLSLEAIMRSVAIEVDASDLEPVSQNREPAEPVKEPEYVYQGFPVARVVASRGNE